MALKDWITQRKLQKIWRDPPRIPVYIDGRLEYVSESARRTAALNMIEDLLLKARIVAMLGEKKARDRYPEAWLE